MEQIKLREEKAGYKVCNDNTRMNSFIQNVINVLNQDVVSVANAKSNRTHHKNNTQAVVCVTPDVQQDKQLIFEEAVKQFESECQAISHFCCQSCQMTGITIRQSHRNFLLCAICQATYTNKKEIEKDLPIW